jgi:hypothetical protein
MESQQRRRRTTASTPAGFATRIDAFGTSLAGVVGAQYQFQPRSLLFRNPFHVGAVLVRRDWIEKAGWHT